MYCGYDLKFLTNGFFDDCDFADPFYEIGLARFTQHRSQIEETLEHFALSNGVLDGTVIQENWFPQIQADIFISHSHSDERTVIIFSELLQHCFGLTSFIDSCVWGYSNDLLRLIDNKYCFIPHSDLYDYEKRNFSTSHVHMMLSTALTMMIDNCETIFFLDTPNSVNTEDVIRRTLSPWIYAEVNISRLIRRRLPQRKVRIQDSMQKSFAETFSIGYELNTSHFIELTEDKFDEWFKNLDRDRYALDILYELLPPKTQGVLYG